MTLCSLGLDGLATLGHGIRGDWSLPSGSPHSNEGDRKVNRQLPRRVMRANREVSRGLRERRKRVSFLACNSNQKGHPGGNSIFSLIKSGNISRALTV